MLAPQRGPGWNVAIVVVVLNSPACSIQVVSTSTGMFRKREDPHKFCLAKWPSEIPGEGSAPAPTHAHAMHAYACLARLTCSQVEHGLELSCASEKVNSASARAQWIIGGRDSHL